MGIKSLFGFGQARDKPVDKAADAGYSFLFGRTTSGKPVNERTAMQTTAVYACVRILAEAIASLPLHVYEYQDDGGKKLVHDHPLYYLLHDEPNPEMTSFVFRETLMSHLLIWGNAYAQIIRDGAGRVLGLYPLLPDKMEVQRDDRGNIYYVYSRNSDENPTFKEYGNIKLKAEDVLHIPGLGFDGLIGYSPIAMAKNAVGMTLACEEYGASFFANGANPGGVLEHPGVLKDPSKVRESWNSVYRGVNNAHKIAVLEEGMKYQQIGIPPEEAQFLETRKFQINEIARLYRIPPHMIGDLDKSSFSNIEQQSLEFVKYTLDPWVIRWEQSLQRSLLLPGEKGKYFIKLNVDGLLRGDYQSRMTGYATARQNGWMSAKAGVIIHKILTDTFSWIREKIDSGTYIDEYAMLQKMQELIRQENIYMDSPPFFGIDEHACDPGYEPNENDSKQIREGSRLIIDIAGRLPEEDAVYYDVSWCMNVGEKIEPEYKKWFQIVYDAREDARQFIQARLDERETVRGYEVDRRLKERFEQLGCAQYLMHRTGHNIGHRCHGIGANLDDYETHDDRCLLPGTMFSIEPGLYTEKYGVRLEYDVHITSERETKVYGPVQDEILVI